MNNSVCALGIVSSCVKFSIGIFFSFDSLARVPALLMKRTTMLFYYFRTIIFCSENFPPSGILHTVQEVGGGHALLAGHLQLGDFQ